MAKADLRKPGKFDLWRQLGPAIEETRLATGLSVKEFAAEIDRDERQVRCWISGEERPQLEAIFAVKRFQGLLVAALAALADDVDVTTTITVRRRRRA